MDNIRQTYAEQETDERQKLIENNLRLVEYIAKKFNKTGVEVEDLISIGTLGLIKAVNTYNPDKKFKLVTYASRCIKNEILTYLRWNKKTKRDVSIEELLNVDGDGNELLLSDILGTEEDILYKEIEIRMEHMQLTTALNRLSDRDRRIIELRFGFNCNNEKGLTQKEVAYILGISQSYVSRIERKALKKLRTEFARDTEKIISNSRNINQDEKVPKNSH